MFFSATMDSFGMRRCAGSAEVALNTKWSTYVLNNPHASQITDNRNFYIPYLG